MSNKHFKFGVGSIGNHRLFHLRLVNKSDRVYFVAIVITTIIIIFHVRAHVVFDIVLYL